MSDNIPLEIQMEIVQRIPDIKWVAQYRSVSKAWKSVIDGKEFVAAHTLRRHHQANRHHLLVRKQDYDYTQVNYVSIVDDDTFPHRKLNVFVPDSNVHSIIIGTSHGLFCSLVYKTDTAVIWNPLIRKTVAFAVPKVVCSKRNLSTVFGFGVCPRNLDPKLVKITFDNDFSRLQHDDVNTSTQVEVFTLSSGGTWRSPLSGNVPHKSIAFGFSRAVIDGVVYWDVVDRINLDDGSRNPKLIMSFDLTSEEFTKINLPEPLAHPHAYLSLSNLRESLAVLETKFNFSGAFNSTQICHVWQMIGHGCTRSFNKLYSINSPDASIPKLLGFRKSGAPVIELKIHNEDYHDYENEVNDLAIYEPESKSITDIGIHGLEGSFSVYSYTETLLLLGQLSCFGCL